MTREVFSAICILPVFFSLIFCYILEHYSYSAVIIVGFDTSSYLNTPRIYGKGGVRVLID